MSHPSVYTQRWLLCLLVQRLGVESQALIEVRRAGYIRFKMGSGEVGRNYPDMDFRVQGIDQKSEFHRSLPEKGGNYRLVGSLVTSGRTHAEPIRSLENKRYFQAESYQYLKGTVCLKHDVLHAFLRAAWPMKTDSLDVTLLAHEVIKKAEFLEYFSAQEKGKGEEDNRCRQEQPCYPVHISHSLSKIWLDYNTKTNFCQSQP